MFEFSTRVFFRCPKCGVSDTVDIEVAEFQTHSSTVFTSEGPVIVACDHCECEFDGNANCNAGGCAIVLDEFPDITFFGDAPSYASAEEDYWFDYNPPESPYRVFLETHGQMVSLLDHSKAVTDDPQLLTRMIFSQLVSAMEAYLSDTLIHYTLQHQNRILNLLSTDKNLSQEKLSLADILRNEDIVSMSVKKYLRSVLYHNLERVRFLYRCSLGIDIVADDKDWKLLLTAVNHRHDCVHRNGATVDGQPNRIFTRTYVRRVAEAISSLARHVERDAGQLDLDLPV